MVRTSETSPVYLVCLVSLVHLVCLVCLDYLIEPDPPDRPDEPERPDGPDRPNRPHEQDRLAAFFSILLEGAGGNGVSGLAACGWTASATTSAIGRTRVETGEADGDCGSFARRAADGN